MIWNKVSIGEFLEERKDRFKPEKANNLKLNRISKIDFSGNIHIDENKLTKTNMILIKSGDLVISGINADKGAVSIYTGKEDVMATIHYSSYSFDSSRINIDYLKWYLKSKTFLKILKEQTKGGIKTELKAKKLLPLVIDLPDLSGQKEILEKIESISVECNDICDLQSELLLDISQLKQAILNEAIQGKLTQEWREHNPHTEPASELLERIKAEKEQLMKDKKIRKEKPLPLITEEEIPFEIPESWSWCKLGEINNTFLGGSAFSSSRFLKSSSIQVLRISNVKDDKLDLIKNAVFIDETNANENLRNELFPNDIIITMTGTRSKRDYCYTVLLKKNDFINKKLFLNQRVGCFRLNNSIETGFLIKVLKLTDLLEPVFQSSTGSANQANIGKNALLNILIPLPPFEEQKAIVEKVDVLMERCNALELEITESEQHANMLMQAVLKEAFESKTEKTKEYSNA
ncbi:MAG: hypothetical protein CMC08_00580 [Flavobacteriaceae bacterium]|nr:hypothetical protein [Flavobacteriaceae bacterium]